MTQYDPGIIQHFADKLYRKASSIVAARTLMGVFAGLAGGFIVGVMLHPSPAAAGTLYMFTMGVGACILGAIGYSNGMERSFVLRLQAQSALCQMMIEVNTRAAACGTSARAGYPQALPPLPNSAAA